MDSPATLVRTGSTDSTLPVAPSLVPAQITPKEIPHKEDSLVSKKGVAILSSSKVEVSPDFTTNLSPRANLSPHGNTEKIDSKAIETLHIKHEALPPSGMLNINNCISPQKKIAEMKDKFQYGFFAIGRGADGDIKIQTKAKEISVKAHEDGSITDAQGKKFDSLSHMLASDKYNKFLLIPVHHDGSFNVEVCEKTLDLMTDEKKLTPEDLDLSKDLAALITPNVSLATRADIMEKRGMTHLDTSSFLALANKLPQPLRHLTQLFFLEDKVKTLGHNLGIDSTILINDFAVKTGGSSKAKSTRCIAESAVEFVIPSKNLDESQKFVIMTALVDTNDIALGEKSPEQALEDYTNGKPVSVLTGWHEHAVSATLYKGYFAYMNRGGREDDPTSSPNLNIYKIPDGTKVTLEMMENLIDSEKVDNVAAKKGRTEWLESGEGIHKELGIEKKKPFISIPKTRQKMGNCTAASAKGAFYTQVVLQLLESNMENKQQFNDEKIAAKFALSKSSSIYKSWESFHRDQQLNDLIALKELVHQADSPLAAREYFNLLYPLGAKFRNKYPAPPNDQIFKEMRVKFENHVKNLDIPIGDCFGSHTENEMTHLAKDFPDKPLSHFDPKGTYGDFVLHTNPSTKEIKINIKEVAGTGTVILTPNSSGTGYLYGEKPVNTLKDLYQAIPNLGLPCDGEPVLFDNS